MAELFLIAGLGNPGPEYEDTRHNVGYRVVEEMQARHTAPWKAGKGEYLYSRYRTSNAEVVLLKPLTYMNNSGRAVQQAMEFFAVPLGGFLVVVDDFALTLGTIRIRTKGTDGGHNGLRSIIAHLGTTAFARIRCGVGHGETPRNMAHFVLSPFEPEEREVTAAMIRRAADAAEAVVHAGFARAMNMFNT